MDQNGEYCSTLIIEEGDLDPTKRAKIEVLLDGSQVLDQRSEAQKEIMDSLPSLIVKRIKEIKPPSFQIKEIELKLKLSGKLFLAEIGGEVVIKLSPE